MKNLAEQQRDRGIEILLFQKMLPQRVEQSLRVVVVLEEGDTRLYRLGEPFRPVAGNEEVGARLHQIASAARNART